MNFDIEELKIVMNTNIKNTKIPLTSSILYHPDIKDKGSLNLNEYPYFTFDVVYPKSTLEYLSYPERVKFFFNKEEFQERLNAYSGKILKNVTEYKGGSSDSKEKRYEEYYKERDSNIQENILTMLEILLPTKFPAINDLTTSYDVMFGKWSYRPFTMNPIITRNFSYIKNGGKTYTFKKLVWLNDIVNNPEYKKLLEDYRKFDVWSQEEIGRKSNSFTKSFEKTLKQVEEFIGYTQEVIDIVSKSFSTTRSKIEKLALKKTGGGTYGDMPNFFNGSTIDGNGILKTILTIYYLIKRINGDNYEFTKKYNIEERLQLSQSALNENINVLLDNIHNDYKNINEKDVLIDTLLSMTKVPVITNQRYLYTVDKSSPPHYTEYSQTLDDHNNFNNRISKMNSIIDSLNANENQSAFKKYKFVLELKTKPYSYIEQKYVDELAKEGQQYRNFAYITMSQYRRPLRESTNFQLQNLLNMEDEETTKECYDFLNKIYKHYMKNDTTITFDKDEQKLVRVDLNYVNTNTTAGQRREIQILVDFIEDEVNNENMSSLFCPFVGEHLGNEFEYLFRMFRFGKVGKKNPDYWKVNKNRMLFSVEHMKSEFLNRENPMQKLDKNLIQNPLQNPLQNPIETTVKNKTREQLESFFMDRIINGDKDIRKNVEEMNKYNIKDQLFDNNILNKVKKDEPSLYRLIERWSENEEKRNNKLLDDIIRQVVGYKSNIEVAENQLTRQNIINNAEEINKKNYEKSLYEFYKAITEKLKQSEEKKMESYSKLLYKGGKNYSGKNDSGKKNDFITRKYRKLSKKYTAKILRKLHK
jgi:hypothetical protein